MAEGLQSSAIYVNSSSSPTSGNAGANAEGGGTTIGNQAGGSANGLNGKIAEVVAFNRALSASEVGRIFQYFAARYGGSWS